MTAIISYIRSTTHITVCTCLVAQHPVVHLLFEDIDADISRVYQLYIVNEESYSCSCFYNTAPKPKLVSRILSESRPTRLDMDILAAPTLIAHILSTVSTITTVIIRQLKFHSSIPTFSANSIAGTIRHVETECVQPGAHEQIVVALLTTATFFGITLCSHHPIPLSMCAAPKLHCTSLSITTASHVHVNQFVQSFPVLDQLDMYSSDIGYCPASHPTARTVCVNTAAPDSDDEPGSTPLCADLSSLRRHFPSVTSTLPIYKWPVDIYTSYDRGRISWLCPAAFLLAVSRNFHIDLLILTPIIKHLRLVDISRD